MSQQPQQQQPVLVYPNTGTATTTTTTMPESSSSRSDGSFGAVFVVLAVIVVISAVACFLGRLCSRKFHRQSKPNKQGKQKGHQSGPREKQGKQNNSQRFHGGDGDIEFGFGKGFPNTKGQGKGGRPAGNGGPRADPVFAYEWEPKAGAY
ncbi:hypothetical protein NMG60_11009036 [Bertholletia excelsa]